MSTTEIEELTEDEMQRLYELYREVCKQQGVHGSLSDFHQWLGER